MARPVRHLRAHPRHHSGRHRRARRSGPGRPAGAVRLRRRAGQQGRHTPGHRRPHVRQKDGDREGHRARAIPWSPTASCASSRARRCNSSIRRNSTRGNHEPVANFHRAPRDDGAHLVCHSSVRRHRLPRAAGGCAAQRGLPHHTGGRRPARRQPRNHGVHGRHAAGARVLHHRRHTVDELHQLAGQHLDHRAVHAGPQDRRRRAGHTGRHLARRRTPPAQHAAAAFLQQGQPGRTARLLPGSRFLHAAHVHGERVCRHAARAAHLHGQRRFPRAGVRRAEVRRARAGGPRQARRPQHRHR